MLHEFLAKNQKAILARAAEFMAAEKLGPQQELTNGLPIYFSQLIEVLRIEQGLLPETKGNMDETAVQQGAELHRLGFTVSQVVQGYGSICQAITDLANAQNAAISSQEFQTLNRTLDAAIAGAVTQFQVAGNHDSHEREVQHLGFLAHELRNTLTSALLSLQMIKNGAVGIGGSTGKLLENSLIRMKDLIDRSLTEVRLKSASELRRERVRLRDLVDQIISVASIEAGSKKISINVGFDPELWIKADLQLVISALSNLTQNAIKFTKPGGTVNLSAFRSGDRVVIEIADECGGLTPQKAKQFMKPFVQGSNNRMGLGLGMSIAYEAILANDGLFEFRDIPGRGCVFRVSLESAPSAKEAPPSAA